MKMYFVRWKDAKGIHSAVMFESAMIKLKKSLIHAPMFWLDAIEQDYL